MLKESQSLHQIHEIEEIEEILNHLTEKSLLLLDIDNTLIEPTQHLGTERWLYSRIEHYAKEGAMAREAFDKAHIEWMSVQGLTKVQSVEEQTVPLIQQLQERGVPIMGLTARNLSLSAVTVQQLMSVGIDFRKTAPHDGGCYFHSNEGILFRDGILFSANTPKHNAFAMFLDEVDHSPEHLVFVDDKQFHLLPFGLYASEKKVPFVGLRYGYLDEKVEAFDHEIAHLQWEKFGTILSDDEAKEGLDK